MLETLLLVAYGIFAALMFVGFIAYMYQVIKRTLFDDDWTIDVHVHHHYEKEKEDQKTKKTKS